MRSATTQLQRESDDVGADFGNRFAEAIERPELPSPGNRIFAFERLLLKRMMQSLGNPPLTLVLWSGEEIHGGAGSEDARVFIHSRKAMLKLVSNPEYWLGEMYAQGRVEVDRDLADVIEAVYRAMANVNK